MSKRLQPIDALIAGYLGSGINAVGLTYRQISAQTGMSINRIGIILRREPPPATIGEIAAIARLLGTTASALTARAEKEVDHAHVTTATPAPDPRPRVKHPLDQTAIELDAAAIKARRSTRSRD